MTSKRTTINMELVSLEIDTFKQTIDQSLPLSIRNILIAEFIIDLLRNRFHEIATPYEESFEVNEFSLFLEFFYFSKYRPKDEDEFTNYELSHNMKLTHKKISKHLRNLLSRTINPKEKNGSFRILKLPELTDIASLNLYLGMDLRFHKIDLESRAKLLKRFLEQYIVDARSEAGLQKIIDWFNSENKKNKYNFRI
jgi:hypothetical protein